jgi:hypothetical protein
MKGNPFNGHPELNPDTMSNSPAIKVIDSTLMDSKEDAPDFTQQTTES